MFLIITRWILLTMRNVSDKISRENQSMHLCSIINVIGVHIVVSCCTILKNTLFRDVTPCWSGQKLNQLLPSITQWDPTMLTETVDSSQYRSSSTRLHDVTCQSTVVFKITLYEDPTVHVFQIWPRGFCSLSAFAKMRKVATGFVISACPSVRPHGTTRFPIDIMSKKFDIVRIFRKSIEKIQVSLNSDNNNSTLHEDRCTVSIISRLILLRMRNVSDKIKTYI